MNPVSAPFPRLATLVALTLPVLAFGQGRFDTSSIPMQFLETSPWTVTAGARYATEGASVRFGQLGSITGVGRVMPEFSTDRAINREYDNGGVGWDTFRLEELDAGGNSLRNEQGRYARRSVDSFGNEIFVGDFLAYQEGRSRNWFFRDDGQVNGDVLALSKYRVETAGATAMSDTNSAMGVEIGVNRRLRRLTRRVELGVGGMFALNELRAQTAGNVPAHLLAETDLYRIFGPAPDAPYNGPSFRDLVDANGNPILVNGQETTVPVAQHPFARQATTLLNGANVFGSWRINGGYFVVRMGPTLRVFVTDRIAFSFEAGLAGAFVGTSYEVREFVELPDMDRPLTNDPTGTNGNTPERSTRTATLGGFYGSGTAEYWMTDRTNAYLGAGYESLGRYQQAVGGRSAEIDIGSTITVRAGLTTRF
jgi:hypothetical protein